MKSFVRGMDTIGHNIANVNTMGFKAQRTGRSEFMLRVVIGVSKDQNQVHSGRCKLP